MSLRTIINSVKRLVFTLIVLVVLTLVSVYVFDGLIAERMGYTGVLHQVGRILIVIIFGSIAIFLIRRSKYIVSKHVGVHTATVFQYFMILIASVIMLFSFLQILQVSPNTLLIGGGVITIVFGLIISTFVGNILAGTLVLMTHQFKVGDTVLVNNIPCEVEEITSLVTKVKNDVSGEIAIPNTAIMQGMVMITSFRDTTVNSPTRLPYALGDRIYTTYLNQEGVVTELTPFHTKIILDSGKEIMFMNSSVLTGSVAVAKINDKSKN